METRRKRVNQTKLTNRNASIEFILLILIRIICGLTSFTKRHHIIRAALEAICFQTKDVLMAIESSIGTKVRKLNVDGPVAANNLLMQLQADLSGLSVCKFQFEVTLHTFKFRYRFSPVLFSSHISTNENL